VVLTEFGEQLFPRLKHLIAEADGIGDAIRSSGGVPIGEVRMGMCRPRYTPGA
jgi:DNA-binding transcriptional LysR family regulator